MKRITLILTVLLAGFFVKAQDWPYYNGAEGNFTVSEKDTTNYLENFAYAEHIWTSEATVLNGGRAQSPRYPCDVGTPGSGGCSPIYYNGDIYMYYFKPAGPWLDSTFIKEKTQDCDTVDPDLWRIACKEVVVCINGSTGETKWKTTFDEYFITNLNQDKKGNKNITIAAGDGKIFTSGVSCMARALDASTGDSLWSAPLEGYSDVKNALSTSIDNLDVSSPLNDNSPAMFVDGMFIARDMVTKKMYGFKPDNPNPQWSHSWVHTVADAPQIFKDNGKEYIIATSGGQVSCIDPQDGNIQWQITGLADNPRTVAIGGNHMMLNRSWNADQSRVKRGMYTITASSYSFEWEFDKFMHKDNYPTLIVDSIAYQPGEREKDYLYALDVETGEVLDSTYFQGYHFVGLMYYFDQKILAEQDIAHGNTTYIMYDATVGEMKDLGSWGPYEAAGDYGVSIPPSIANGKFYYRGEDEHRIHCIDISEKVKNLASVTLKNPEYQLLTDQSTTMDYIIRDQYGVEYDSAVNLDWMVKGAGSFDNAGTYTAPSSGGLVDTVILTVSEEGTEVKDTGYVTVKQPQSINCPDLGQVYYGIDSFDLQCTATSGLPVEYIYVSGNFSLSGSTVKPYPVESTARIDVKQPGNETYAAADPMRYTFEFTSDESDTTTVGFNKRTMDKKELSIYPNPTSGIVEVEVGFSTSHLKLYNVLGNLIKVYKAGNKEDIVKIDLSGYPEGIYYLKTDKAVRKIMKQ